jgi:hypothetical protein
MGRASIKALGSILGSCAVLGIGISFSCSAAAATKPVVLTSEQINAALLHFTDLPTEAVVPGAAPMENESTPVPTPTGGVCDGPNEPALAHAAGYQAVGARLIGQPSSPVAAVTTEAIYAFPSENRAKTFVKSYGRAGLSCHNQWTAKPLPDGHPDNAPMQWSLKNVKVPKAGEQAFAFETAGTNPVLGDPVSTLALVRVGNHVVVMGRSGNASIMTGSAAKNAASTKIAVEHLKSAIKDAAQQ